MGMKIEDEISIGILVSSVEVTERQPFASSIKTLSESSVHWDEVINRSIDEQRRYYKDHVRQRGKMPLSPPVKSVKRRTDVRINAS